MVSVSSSKSGSTHGLKSACEGPLVFPGGVEVVFVSRDFTSMRPKTKQRTAARIGVRTDRRAIAFRWGEKRTWAGVLAPACIRGGQNWRYETLGVDLWAELGLSLKRLLACCSAESSVWETFEYPDRDKAHLLLHVWCPSKPEPSKHSLTLTKFTHWLLRCIQCMYLCCVLKTIVQLAERHWPTWCNVTNVWHLSTHCYHRTIFILQHLACFCRYIVCKLSVSAWPRPCWSHFIDCGLKKNPDGRQVAPKVSLWGSESILVIQYQLCTIAFCTCA